MNTDQSPSFEVTFDKAYKYARKIVHGITLNKDDKENLLQDFCLTVLSNKKKYNPILQYKRTVYLILKGLHSNQARKQKTINASRYVTSSVHENVSAKIDLEIITNMVPGLLYKNLIPNATKEAILTDHLSKKLSGKQIAEKHNVSTATVHRIIHQKSGECKSLTLQYWQMYVEGYDHHEIASTLNVSPHSVSQNLYKINSKLRHIFKYAA